MTRGGVALPKFSSDWTHGGGVNFVISGPAPFWAAWHRKPQIAAGLGGCPSVDSVHRWSNIDKTKILIEKLQENWTIAGQAPEAPEA
ncbi:hypothetical protein M0657_005625 [Pyricularia oryzae]|uniref:Uncharacterized protein n=1 Tax=Pyricularia oryzae (strain P131) TaxID=1143193 RepID=L7JIA0_PYRO1|nr:hypothetical protein M9X92_006699 [Pyricularia oryzae]KAI7922356.1 hypothetical protein M0657_005625 [Pyricularia oryzae]